MEHFKEEQSDDLWVFAYGSLMWNPGFDYVERKAARLEGYKRSFCLASIIYRGTPEAPGLVLGLQAAKGGYCDGIAFRVSSEERPLALAYLTKREMSNGSYSEEMLPTALTCGRNVSALSYVIRPEHNQYRGVLTHEEQAQIIATAEGPAGKNSVYLEETITALRANGIRDAELETLHQKVLELISLSAR